MNRIPEQGGDGITDSELAITNPDPSLYNDDLAPVKHKDRTWGWFEIFNVWSNDIQSLFGYTLAASLFIAYGLNGWAVMAAIILAGVIVMLLVNLTGSISVKYGLPFPVIARVSMGVRGANLPAMIRATIAIFWYGVQTYFASTALALLINSLIEADGSAPQFLGMTAVAWLSFVIVWLFQIALFWQGVDRIKNFLNFAGPFVYVVMLVLMIMIWYQAGGELLPAVGSIFSGADEYENGPVVAFMTITGTMVAYFAAVVINYGDFARFVRSDREMRFGNLIGLPLNVAFFSFIALIITAGTVVLYGEKMTNPTDIIERVDALPLTIIAAITFFMATVGINLVANFIPPAYDLANLFPSKINFRTGGLITAVIAFFVGALWVSVISQIGIAGFVNALGAVISPIYGVMMVDYYLLRKRQVNVQHLFSVAPDAAYYYVKGWNRRALLAFGPAAIIASSTVWVEQLSAMSGFAWMIGAFLGAVFYYLLAFRQPISTG